MPYNIQPFTAKQLPQIIAIENSVFKGDRFSKKLFEDLLNQPNVLSMLVVSENDEIAGYIMLRYTASEAEILTIAVAPSFTRKGAGIFLMENIIIKLLSVDIKDIFLEVRPSNIPAINFYKKFGAIEVGVRKNYYENEDALVYHLKLDVN